MDVSVRAFLVPEEFVELLQVASGCGGSILYEPTRRGAYARVVPGGPLPDELLKLLRAPWSFECQQTHFITCGDMGVDPGLVDSIGVAQT
jgi:hypothetical protein